MFLCSQCMRAASTQYNHMLSSNLKQLGALMVGRRVERCLLVLDSNAGGATRELAERSLTAAAIDFSIFECASRETSASLAEADAASAAARDCGAQAIIGLGDSNLLNLSKAAAALAPQVVAHKYTSHL